MSDLSDFDEELAKAVARSDFLKRFLYLFIAALALVLLAVQFYTITKIDRQQEQGEEQRKAILQTSEQLAGCFTSGSICFDQLQARADDSDNAIKAFAVASNYCAARLIPPQSVVQIQKCVFDNIDKIDLKMLNTPAVKK